MRLFPWILFLFPLSARAADTDGDGLEDADEVLAYLPPLVADSDGDGLYDHLDPDMDGDGIPNVDECRLGGVSGLALANGGFEEPAHPGSGYALESESAVPGWDTTAPDNLMEFWWGGFIAAPYEGTQLVELNANYASTLYQDVSTTYGDVYIYAFSHRGRSGADTMRFSLSGIEVRTVTDSTSWGRYGGVITIVDATTSFQFEAVSSTGGGASYGNLLDAISFTPACDLDTDADGTPDALDDDEDNDGVIDGVDACPGLDDATADPDGDLLCGSADACPLDNLNDFDADGVCGDLDLCAGFDDAQDMDGDGMPDGCDTDRDGDGWFEWDDCDENDSSVGAAETYYPDADGDGYGVSSSAFTTCAPGVMFVLTGGDCDDSDLYTYPGASEGCFDLIDYNCDGSVSFSDYDLDGVCADADPCPVDNPDDTDGDGLCQSSDPCPLDPMNDADGDGACGDVDSCPLDPLNDSDGDGACGDVDVCEGANDYADMDSDGQPDACDPCPLDPLDDSDGDGTCDNLDLCAGSDDREDSDADGVADGCDPCPDVPYESERDLDGDGTYDECDLDGDDDGVPVGEDCDDLDLSIGAVTLWFLDYDRDGFGDSMTPTLACEQPPSYVSLAGDCEDALSDTFPGAVEICTDETDKNCDGVLSFADPDYDGACGSSDPCPLVYGFECDTGADTGDTGSSDTADTDTSIDTAITEETASPEECDTAPTVVLVDEEDPELYRGGWRCGVVGGSPSGVYLVLGSMLAALWSRRASRR
jgi:hypothetical protein